MEKTITISLVGILAIAILWAVGVLPQQDQSFKGYDDPTAEVINVVGTEASPIQFATSTCSGCSGIPTTTTVFYTAGKSFMDFNIKHIATHTVSDLFGTLFFSNDSGCQGSTTDPDIAWFQQSDRTNAAGVSTLRRTKKEWTETRTKGANYINWGTVDVNSTCVKAVFETNSTTDDSYLWVEASIW